MATRESSVHAELVSHRYLVRAVAIGFSDHCLQFAGSLALILLFLAFSEPSQYGIFLVARNMALLPLSLHSALVSVPMQVLVPIESSQSAFVGGIRSFSNRMAAVSALTVLVIFTIIRHESSMVGIASALLSASLIVRERARVEWYSVLKPRRGLRLSALFSLSLLLLLLPIVLSGHFGALGALWSIAAACILAVTLAGNLLARHPRRTVSSVVAQLRPYWGWTVLGAGLAWLQANLYLFGTYLAADSAAVGHVGMARVILLPITLMAGAVGLSVRPQLADLLENTAFRKILALSVRLLVLAALLAVFYALVATVSARRLIPTLLPTEYLASGQYITYWLIDGVFLLLFAVAAALLVAARAFRTLAIMNLVSVSVGFSVALGLSGRMGVPGVLMGQITADGLLAVSAIGAAARVATELPASRALRC